MEEVRTVSNRFIDNVEHVIIGKRRVIERVVVGLLSQGHILIEDVPGVGKTMLARALAKSLGCKFRRIQFTPDMLPSDVTGVSIYNQKTLEFEFRPGPIVRCLLVRSCFRGFRVRFPDGPAAREGGKIIEKGSIRL